MRGGPDAEAFFIDCFAGFEELPGAHGRARDTLMETARSFWN